MKIKMNPVQFGCSPVVCSDLIMAEMLAGSPSLTKNDYGNKRHQFSADFKYGRSNSNSRAMFEFCMRSGAKLRLGDKRGHFYIFGYSADGGDTIAAVAELKMLYAIRQARMAAHEMGIHSGMYTLVGTKPDLRKVTPWLATLYQHPDSPPA